MAAHLTATSLAATRAARLGAEETTFTKLENSSAQLLASTS
jgi:hypothetical protein